MSSFSLKRSNLSEDFEEEDEWEREASSSSTSKRKPYNKPQPNPYAKQIAILDDQHNLLSKKENDLVEELASLQDTIKQLDIEEQELNLNVNQSKQEYLASIQETISIIKNNEQAENDVDHDNTSVNYFTYDEFLSRKMDQLMEQWKSTLVIGANDEEMEEKIKSLEKDFQNTEFDVLDLIAVNKGYEARIQLLNRDRAKLNSLPQILSILQSDTAKLKSEMENTTQQNDTLEKEFTRPHLRKLSELKIALPLRQDQYIRDIQLMQDLISDLDEVIKIAMKQRACQDLVSYVDNEEKGSTNYLDNLEEYAASMQDQATDVQMLDHEGVEKKIILENNHDEPTQLIKKLLDTFFEQRKDIELFPSLEKENMTLMNQINALKEYEQKLKHKWEQNLQFCLDSVQQLTQLQSRMSETLFADSDTNGSLKSYADLQKDLESRATELQTTISRLQKDTEDSNKSAIFQQQKKLFSMFFSDPDSFIELFAKIKKYELDQINSRMI